LDKLNQRLKPNFFDVAIWKKKLANDFPPFDYRII
jgi:hypothetical protein